MARVTIQPFWDRETLNALNRMFEELYNNLGSSRVNAKEALEKAKKALENSDEFLQLSEGLQQQINDLVLGDGTSIAEIVQARDGEKVLNDRLNRTDNRIEELQRDMARSVLFDKLYGTLSKLSTPSDLAVDIPFDVFTSISGKVEHNYDVSVNKNSVNKRYYVDVNNGDNSNDGTEGAPFKSLERAFRYGDADEIVLLEGVYDWNHGSAGTVPISSQKKRFNLIGEGDVFLGAHRGYQNWSLISGNVYHTNVSSVSEVVDINDYHNPIFYERKTSIEEVSSAKGSYHINGNDVYVRTLDDTSPNEYILLNMPHSALQLNDFEHVYIEDIVLTNTLTMDNPNVAGKLYLKNVDSTCSTADNAISILGDVSFIFQNSGAFYAERDGFNYHIRNGKLPKGIEIDCIGAYNGRDGNNSNNGSTMHDGGSIARINGEYHHNHGPNVIDVNEGTTSLNVGVHAHHSTATSDISNTDFKNGNDGPSKMWLINCVSHDSNYSVVTQGGGDTIYENSLLTQSMLDI